MEIKVIFATARCAAVEICDGSIYESDTEKEIYVNGTFYEKTRKVIVSIYGLKPDREYEVAVKAEGGEETVKVRTPGEFVTLNVREFGAKGDGIQDDTPFIQAAILSCPKDSPGSGGDLPGYQPVFEERYQAGAGGGRRFVGGHGPEPVSDP